MDNIPTLSAPIFYSHDSLLHYARLAYETEDPEALCITGTSAYHLTLFDKAAADSLTPVSLDEADIMLLRSAELGYEPAFLIIHFLNQLGLWKHSLPDYDYDSLAAPPVDPSDIKDGYFRLEVKE